MSCKSFRYVIICLCATAVFLEFATRTNINNAIVSMLDEKINSNVTILRSDYCPDSELETLAKNSNSSTAERNDVTYDWSPTTQGLILGAFFYGYMIFQVPSGRLAELFGGKWIVAIGLLASGFINLITPHITDSVPLLITSRVFLGLCQGVIMPSIFSLNVNWMSAEERSFGFGLMNVGGNLGAVFASAVTGYVCQVFGWPMSFRSIGAIAVVWTLLVWLVFVRSKPQPDEVNLLNGVSDCRSYTESVQSSNSSLNLSCNNSIQSEQQIRLAVKTRVPWIQILRNKAVLSAAMSRICGTFGYLTLQTKLPAYLESVLHQSAANNGFLNSFLFMATAVSMATGPCVSEQLISRQWLSRTNTRKLFTGIAQYGLTACFLLIPLAGCDTGVTVALLVFGMLLYGNVMGGDVIVPAEVSHNFATTIFACINMWANFAGVVAPLLIGFVLEGATDGMDLKQKWDNVFFMAAAVVFTGTSTFLLFGSSERQDFDLINESHQTEKGH